MDGLTQRRERPLLMLPEFMVRAASLPKERKAALVKALYLLSQNVRHPSLQTKKIHGSRAELYECRVDQGTRLVYDTLGEALRFWYVGDHDTALGFGESHVRMGGGLVVEDIEMQEAPEEAGRMFRFLAFGAAPGEEAWLEASNITGLVSRISPGS